LKSSSRDGDARSPRQEEEVIEGSCLKCYQVQSTSSFKLHPIRSDGIDTDKKNIYASKMPLYTPYQFNEGSEFLSINLLHRINLHTVPIPLDPGLVTTFYYM
jgi:hypothetical protein